ncbi:MAG: hypothetical protein KF819_04330 [Labilithrix sp.]|nr:hypothetical protein [Labilithrix sp.]
MQRAGMIALGLALALGCYREPSRPHGYPPPGYYPPPGHHPPPGYYPPTQPQPPQVLPPAPQQPAPPPAPQQPAPASNPWGDLLASLLANPPPIPPWWGPIPPPPPTTPPPAPPPTTAPTAPAPGALPPIGPRALDLANAINRYRGQNGLPPIPISKSLSFVADTHARDLRDSPKVAPECNGHSWSSRGPWSACCYTADHAQAKCMWNKPGELTALKATGFEIAIGQPGVSTGVVLDSEKAISTWQGSALHNDVLLNRNTWQKTTWRAMGAGIVDSHACAWFSAEADPAQ